MRIESATWRPERWNLWRDAGLLTTGVVTCLVLLTACSGPEPEMRSVPTVAGKGTPKEAAAVLERAGFAVEFEQPCAYCIPTDRLCSRPLNDEALEKLVVETQRGTQGEQRPAGSTITLILGSRVVGARSD